MVIAHTKIDAIAICDGELKGWESKCPYCNTINRVLYNEEGRLINISTPATARDNWCKHSIGSHQYEGGKWRFTFLKNP